MKYLVTPIAFLAVTSALAQAGTLDPTFDADGMATLSAGGPTNGQSVAAQPDGKIVAAGYIGSGSGFAVTRFNTDGSLDNSFSGNGWLTTTFGSGDGFGRSVLVQPDGKILVTGNAAPSGGVNSFALARYNSDGTPDAGFGTGGVLTTSIGLGASRASSSALQPDGKIVTVGWRYGGAGDTTVVVRYASDGTLDGSFATGGIFKLGATSNMDAYDVAVQPDGRIVVVGDSGGFSTYHTFVLRLNTDGTFDTGFGNGGYTSASMGAGASEGYGVALQADGRIVVCGRSNATGNYDAILFRFNTDGTLDNSFDGDGKVSTALTPQNDSGNGVLVQPDGKILLAGFQGAGGTLTVALARYLNDGSLDPSFGTGGVGDAPDGSGYGVALLPDGRIAVGGGISSQSVLSAYLYTNDAGGVGVPGPEDLDVHFQLYPAPVTDHAVIEFTLAEAATVAFELHDIQGRLLPMTAVGGTFGAGMHRAAIDLSFLTTGAYLLSLSANGREWTKAFVKE